MSYRTVHGHNLTVGFAEGAAFALGKTCSLEIKQNLTEVCDPNEGGWKRFVPGTAEWSMSCSGLYSIFAKELSDAQSDRQPVSVRFTDGSNAIEYHGEAFIESLQMTGTIKELSTYTVRLRGNGPINSIQKT